MLLVPALLLGASPAAAASAFPPGDGAFHTYAEMTADLTSTAARFPAIASMRRYGTSFDGRALWAVKVSDHVATDEAEPEVLVIAGTHAREHLSVEQALIALHWLVFGYGHDATITRLVNNREIWILPEVNPDGAEFDIGGAVYHSWRKNRQPNAGSSAVGTDINRNFGFHWGCCGQTSSDPASLVYRGPAPFSTPEASALRDFVRSRVILGDQQIRVALNVHTFGKQILYPYGYTTRAVPADMRPRDHRAFVALANQLAARNGYRPVQEGRLVVNSGGFTDWAYGKQRIFAFTFELGPATQAAGGFYPHGTRIGALTSINRSAILHLFDLANCPYRADGETSFCRLLPPLHAG